MAVVVALRHMFQAHVYVRASLYVFRMFYGKRSYKRNTIIVLALRGVLFDCVK